MARFITIISGKGGVGKTTASINLASALNMFGKTTTVVDANLTTPNIGIYLGTPIAPKTIHDVLAGRIPIEDSVYLHKSGTKVIPGNLSLESLSSIKPGMLKKAIQPLDKTNDFVILDAAAGLGREALASIEAANEILILTNDELPAVADALKTIKVCEELKKEVIGVVVNRRKEQGIRIKDIEDMLERPVISIIPEDENMREALTKRDAIVHTHPNSQASYGYRKLANFLTGNPYYEEPLSVTDNRTFMQRLLDALGIA